MKEQVKPLCLTYPPLIEFWSSEMTTICLNLDAFCPVCYKQYREHDSWKSSVEEFDKAKYRYREPSHLQMFIDKADRQNTHERTARNRARTKRIKAIKKILLFWR